MQCCHYPGYYASSLHLFCSATAPTEIYTLSLHDALPICRRAGGAGAGGGRRRPGPRERRDGDGPGGGGDPGPAEDRKSTRLNSSHVEISYAVFCLKKKK